MTVPVGLQGNITRNKRRYYRTIGEENNRNRRIATPTQVARKMMLLDYVLGHRGVT